MATQTYRWMIHAADDARMTYSMEEPDSRIEAESLDDAIKQYQGMIDDGLIPKDGEAQEI